MGSTRPRLVGIVNVTPDSFSDGGRFLQVDAAVTHGLQLVAEGADWLDIGGESTRPGSDEVPAAEERARVVPVIRALRERLPDVTLSIDTKKPEVAAAAIEAGADVLNDVSGLEDPEMVALAARTGVQVVLMHMRGTPRTMQQDTRYDDVLETVTAYLQEQVERAVAGGVPRERIWVDPGVGFGKSMADNPRLIAHSAALHRATGCRVFIGASRKRFIGALTGVDSAADRVFGSVGAALAAAACGAQALRVHDVSATHQALTVFWAVKPS